MVVAADACQVHLQTIPNASKASHKDNGRHTLVAERFVKQAVNIPIWLGSQHAAEQEMNSPIIAEGLCELGRVFDSCMVPFDIESMIPRTGSIEYAYVFRIKRDIVDREGHGGTFKFRLRIHDISSDNEVHNATCPCPWFAADDDVHSIRSLGVANKETPEGWNDIPVFKVGGVREWRCMVSREMCGYGSDAFI